jgi:hypothetical protein
MPSKEAQARIKINKLLEKAGWRFFDDEKGSANIRLELNVKIKEMDINKFGADFETTKNGFVDFLLLDNTGKPLVVSRLQKVPFCRLRSMFNIHRAPNNAQHLSKLRLY